MFSILVGEAQPGGVASAVWQPDLLGELLQARMPARWRNAPNLDYLEAGAVAGCDLRHCLKHEAMDGVAAAAGEGGSLFLSIQ